MKIKGFRQLTWETPQPVACKQTRTGKHSIKLEWDGKTYRNLMTKHRVPFWCTPLLHMILEKLISEKIGFFLEKTPRLLYHILFGWVCGYNTKEGLLFYNRCKNTHAVVCTNWSL